MTRTIVRITGIAAGGAGVGRLPDGRAVFVHRTAPGDEAEVRLLAQKRRWARGSLVRLRTTGPDRRDAPCPHYDVCGGCTLEHLDYQAQLRAKATIVVETLRRIGGVNVDPPDVVASTAEFRYRNRVSFTLVRTGAGRVVAGFHTLDRADRVFDVDERCLLPEPAVAETWRGIRVAWGEEASRLPSGDRLRLTVRASADGVATLFIDGGFHPGRPVELLERVPRLASIWHRPHGSDTPSLLAGREAITERWRDERIELAGAVFLQVNRDAAALMEDHVVATVGDAGRLDVIDAYCGVGLLAHRLARSGSRVTGIELDARAVEEAARNAPPGARFLAGTVETRIAESLPADVVVLNPPRAGVHADVCAALLRRPPGRIVYVSCDPATLARDVARLAGRFTLRNVRCFDLFPQTAHIETVAELACVTT
ncbi:MAG: class I SAM-dependent RNA methyltransferase [Longimicrobiales bacterium]